MLILLYVVMLVKDFFALFEVCENWGLRVTLGR